MGNILRPVVAAEPYFKNLAKFCPDLCRVDSFHVEGCGWSFEYQGVYPIFESVVTFKAAYEMLTLIFAPELSPAKQ